jgi:serine/threonine protein phosphatase PrpC
MPNNHENPMSALEEALPQREKLLNESTTGAQVLMILGQEPLEQGYSIPRLTRNLIERAAKNIPYRHREMIKKASFNERDEFWKNTPPAERMDKWEKSMNAFLDPIKKDTARTTELTFLKKLLKEDDQKNLGEVEVTADTIYSTFMQGEGGGDVEFFARRIADNKTITVDEIEQNKDLIRNLGNIYGENSAKISELLTYGIFNAKNNFDAFISSAQKNLDERKYGEVIWAALYKKSKEGEKKEKELYLFADAQGKTEKGDKTAESPNQDDFFVDPKHGAFGVFDGLGSLTYSADASKTAKTCIEQALSRIDENLDIDATEKQVEQALIGANNAIRENIEARYKRMKTDLENNIADKLTDKEFEEIYKKEYPSVWELLKKIRHDLRLDNLTKITDVQDNKIWDKAEGATTASVVKLWRGKIGNEEKKKAIIGNVGDSRVYLLHEGKLEAMTIDGNPLYMILGEVEAKRIQDAKANGVNTRKLYEGETVMLKESEKIHTELWGYDENLQKKYPFKNGEVKVPYSEINDYAIAVLGEKSSRQKMQSIDVKSGDRVLITTDGIHDGVLNKNIEKILKDPKYSDCGKAAKALIELASGETTLTDDMTAVVVNIK